MTTSQQEADILLAQHQANRDVEPMRLYDASELTNEIRMARAEALADAAHLASVKRIRECVIDDFASGYNAACYDIEADILKLNIRRVRR